MARGLQTPHRWWLIRARRTIWALGGGYATVQQLLIERNPQKRRIVATTPIGPRGTRVPRRLHTYAKLAAAGIGGGTDLARGVDA